MQANDGHQVSRARRGESLVELRRMRVPRMIWSTTVTESASRTGGDLAHRLSAAHSFAAMTVGALTEVMGEVARGLLHLAVIAPAGVRVTAHRQRDDAAGCGVWAGFMSPWMAH